jgi:uncharacterized membrane protein YfcA
MLAKYATIVRRAGALTAIAAAIMVALSAALVGVKGLIGALIGVGGAPRAGAVSGPSGTCEGNCTSGGGGVGAWLLIVTPSPVFARLVPWLILFATILFMMQAPVTRWLKLPAAGDSTKAWWIGAMVFQFFSASYGGYFGAGNGILMLAAMGLLGLHDIHRANGIKNFLGICINSVAVVAFSISHLVSWPRALLMAVGALAGGYVGARTARRVGRTFIRRAIVVIGFVITIVMLWRMR